MFLAASERTKTGGLILQLPQPSTQQIQEDRPYHNMNQDRTAPAPCIATFEVVPKNADRECVHNGMKSDIELKELPHQPMFGCWFTSLVSNIHCKGRSVLADK